MCGHRTGCRGVTADSSGHAGAASASRFRVPSTDHDDAADARWWSAQAGADARRIMSLTQGLTPRSMSVTVQETRWVRWFRRLGDSGWDAHFRPAMDDISTNHGSTCHRFLGRRALVASTLSSWLTR